MSKYMPKMKDRVRIAWAVPEYQDLIGHTGVICGVVEGFATALELDEEVYGKWIFQCGVGEFRVEPIE